MAIEKNGESAQSAADRSSQSFSNAATQAAPAASGARRAIGISELGSIRQSTINRSGNGETVDSFKRGFEKILEPLTKEQKNQFQFMTINRDTDRVYMSSLVLARALAWQDTTYVIVYSMPVEASNPINEVRSFQNAGQTSEISWAPSDVIDERYGAVLYKSVLKEFGDSVKVINAGSRVLPIELKADDESHLLRILFEADQAMISATTRDVTKSSPATISVDMFRVDGARANVNVVTTPFEADDSVGNPVRSDITVELRATMNVNQNMANQSLNERNRDIGLTRSYVFVDPTYDTRHLAKPPVYPGAPVDTRCFLPRIIIRSVDSDQQTPLTPESHLLGIISTTALSQHIGLWANSLRPRNFATASADVQRMMDVGAFGLVVPMDDDNRTKLEHYDTNPKKFSDQDFEFLVTRTFMHDDTIGPIYTLMIEESGERTWLTDSYYYAADGVSNSTRDIINAADNLTNGQFSKIWSTVTDQRITHNDNNRVHMGYFIDAQGRRIDLQHVDTLAMLNIHGTKDKQLVFDWIQTGNPSTGTLEQRLARREQILRGTFNQVTIKGYARLVTFYPQFLETVNRALRAAGLEISPANTRSGEFQTRPQYGVLDPAMFSMGASRTGGVFASSQINLGAGRPGIGGLNSLGML